MKQLDHLCTGADRGPFLTINKMTDRQITHKIAEAIKPITLILDYLREEEKYPKLKEYLTKVFDDLVDSIDIFQKERKK